MMSEISKKETNADSQIEFSKTAELEKLDDVEVILPMFKPLKLKILKPLQMKILKSPTIENTILMYDGTTKIDKDIKVGDTVMGVDSQRNIVTQTQYVEEICYKIIPVKGDSYFVGESDILSLAYSTNPIKSWREGKKDFSVSWFDNTRNEEACKTFSIKNHGDKERANDAAEKFHESILTNNYFDMSVKEFLTKTMYYQQFSKTYREGFDFPHIEFKFDPYVIGLWLGDGTEKMPEITSADPEIVSYLREYFARFNLHVTQYGGETGITYRISSGTKYGGDGRNSFLNYLKDETLLNNKHIPLKFIMTSRENRLRLLAGLLDSDGSLQSNCYDFIQKREKLFDEFIFLCRSLGFACYKQPCVKVCTNAPNGPKAGNYFRCSVSGEGLEEIPTLLSRKQAEVRKLKKRTSVSGIELENIGVQTYIRIITEQPKYLLRDFTVRHRYDILQQQTFTKKRTLNKQCYGYIRDTTDPNNIDVCINEKEAKVIKLLFSFQKRGLSNKKISEEMNKLGIKTQTGKEWSERNVRHFLDKKSIYMGGERKIGDMVLRWPVILDETMI